MQNCKIALTTPILQIRNEIECFWESNGGCKKADCPFKHTIPCKVLGGDQVSEIALHTESVGRSVPIKVPPTVAKHGSPVKRASLRLPLSPDPLLVVDGKKTGVAAQKDLDFEVKSFEEIMREKRRRLDGQPKSPNPDVLSCESSFSTSGVRQQEKPALDRHNVRGVESPEPEITSPSTSGDSIKASPSFMEMVDPVALGTESNPKLTVSDEEDLDIDRQLAELDELINS